MLNLIPAIMLSLLRNSKSVFGFLLLAMIGALCYKGYTYTSDLMADISKNKALVIQQAEIIKQQTEDIKNISQSMAALQASHEATLAIIQELSVERNKVERVVVKRKTKIDKVIKQIDESPIAEEDKLILRSSELISDLNGTYCELFSNQCNVEKDK